MDEVQETSLRLLGHIYTLRDHRAPLALNGDPDQCTYSVPMADAQMVGELGTRCADHGGVLG